MASEASLRSAVEYTAAIVRKLGEDGFGSSRNQRKVGFQCSCSFSLVRGISYTPSKPSFALLFGSAPGADLSASLGQLHPVKVLSSSPQVSGNRPDLVAIKFCVVRCRIVRRWGILIRELQSKRRWWPRLQSSNSAQLVFSCSFLSHQRAFSGLYKLITIISKVYHIFVAGENDLTGRRCSDRCYSIRTSSFAGTRFQLNFLCDRRRSIGRAFRTHLQWSRSGLGRGQSP